jgi:S1-C subfamily serine protease
MNGLDLRILPPEEARRFQIPPMPSAPGPRLGVTFIMLDEQAAAEYEVEQTEGALITDVAERSPAVRAGLLIGDVVLTADGQVLTTEFSLRDAVAVKQPGEVITLEVLRGEETLILEVTLGQPEQFGSLPGVAVEEGQLF